MNQPVRDEPKLCRRAATVKRPDKAGEWLFLDVTTITYVDSVSLSLLPTS